MRFLLYRNLKGATERHRNDAEKASVKFCEILWLILVVLLTSCHKKPEEIESQQIPKVGRPQHVRGIHLSCWVAGEKKFYSRFDNLLGREKLNTIVIAVKEYTGDVYLPSAKIVADYGIKTLPIKNLENYLPFLKSKKVYPIARLVVFKDTQLAKKHPEFAVKTSDGKIWRDKKGNSWTDPYNKNVWKYNVEIARRAQELGFEEIQFDYIRFPSDGDTKNCRYSQVHNSTAATQSLIDFIRYAKKELTIAVSVDVFGLTPSVEHDMGIGQRFLKLADVSDFISPMMYPSHYGRNEYGIKEPDKEPYKTVFRTVSDAKKLLKENAYKIRPYLQDFSLGHNYGAEEVKAQIKACYDNGVFDWLLWDPKCKYTLEAIEEMVKYTPANYPPSTAKK